MTPDFDSMLDKQLIKATENAAARRSESFYLSLSCFVSLSPSILFPLTHSICLSIDLFSLISLTYLCNILHVYLWNFSHWLCLFLSLSHSLYLYFNWCVSPSISFYLFSYLCTIYLHNLSLSLTMSPCQSILNVIVKNDYELPLLCG